MVSKSLEIVANRLSLSNISVRERLARELPPIRADFNQMLQVFINLLVNAADAIGGDGGEISIVAAVVEGDPSQVEVQLADTGCGIPPEQASKVFEPFYTTKEREGTGLGLSVVWGIVDKHGGRIDLESEVGVGTTVTLRLPAARGAPIKLVEAR